MPSLLTVTQHKRSKQVKHLSRCRTVRWECQRQGNSNNDDGSRIEDGENTQDLDIPTIDMDVDTDSSVDSHTTCMPGNVVLSDLLERYITCIYTASRFPFTDNTPTSQHSNNSAVMDNSLHELKHHSIHVQVHLSHLPCLTTPENHIKQCWKHIWCG